MPSRRNLFVILFLATAAFAQRIAPSPDAAKQVREIFAGFDHTDSPGCAVGVSIDGVTVLNSAWGMADLEHKIALSTDSVLDAGSVSKQFTAASVLLLAQQGTLSLDDPLRKYLPELPDYGSSITIRHLLYHTSGLRDWGEVADIGGWPRGSRASSNMTVLDITSRQKALNHAPGAEFSYTNTGYNLLAIVVERATGKSLATFTREKIFLPLGMMSTEWRDDYRRIVRNRAIAYDQDGGATHQDMPFENAYGNGGLLTTVSDLLRWNHNFAEMKIGGPLFVESQLQQGRLNDGRNLYYAGGLEIGSHRGVREVSHAGWTGGYRAWLGRYPDQGLSVALLCNTATAETTELGRAVADVYLSSVLPKAVTPVHVDPQVLRLETGLYRDLRDHTTLRIELTNGHLEVARQFELFPSSAKFFRVGPSVEVLEFDSDAAGKITGMRDLHQGLVVDTWEKIEPVSPARADLEAMTGDYASDEAEVTLKVTLEPNGLVIHRRPDTVFPLTPAYRDGFTSTLGSVRFIRDSAGRVTEMSVGRSQVWDLRLPRVQPAKDRNR